MHCTVLGGWKLSEFATDYLILTFASTLATIQISATLGRLDGLLLIKNLWVTRILGILSLLGIIIWFFGSAPRNINDTQGGLDANYQAILFFYGGLAALGTTLLVSSLINRKGRSDHLEPDEGFDALRKTNYYGALRNNLKYWMKNWKTQMKQYFSG
mgnify:CR=1 FL=1